MNEHLLDGVLVRGAVYVALALAVGPLVWAGFVERGPVSWARWRVVTSIVMLVAAALLGVVQAMFAFVEEWSLDGMAEVLRDTAYGRMFALHVGVSLSLALVLAMRRPALTLAMAVTTAATLTLLGHATVQSSAHVIVQLVHALAAIAWLGGLGVLLERVARRTVPVVTLPRFGRFAAVAVIVLATSGVARTASFIRGVHELAWSTWLGVLVLKLVFFAGALAIAAGHRRGGFGGLREAETPATWRRFHTLLALEVWAVACALLLAALLSQLPPP
jgi:putative copper export protein